MRTLLEVILLISAWIILMSISIAFVSAPVVLVVLLFMRALG